VILDWRKFVLRSDIKNLPLEEQRRRFLKEQLYNDTLLNEQKQKQYEFYMSQMQPKGGSGGFSGQGIDGPIAGATVTSNVGTTTTNAVGVFKFPKKPSGPITLTGGTDAITGLPFEGELIGYPEYKTISPITTFAHYLKEASVESEKFPLTIDEAVTRTFVSSSDYFGIDLPIENKDIILQKDYIGEAIANNNKIGISAQAISTQIEAITETVGVALDGSVVASKSRDRGDTIPQFAPLNRKRTAYAALGRQIIGQGQIIPDTITRDVVFFNPLNNRIEKGGLDFENSTALGNQLTATIEELTELAKQEQFTNNYLTTRIQAVNRAQKTTIKNETRNAVENRGSFSNINTVSTSREVEDALKQIEKDKANETAPTLDGTPQLIERPAFWQERKGKGVVQLNFNIEKEYYYFGVAKDLPILMRAIPPKELGGETTYVVAEFTYATDSTGISLDAPCEIRTSSTDEDTNITTNTTYTFRPFVSSKGEEFPNVGLRLSEISQSKEVPKNSVTHISTEGTYTVIQIRNGLRTELIPTIVEGMLGNEIQLKVNKEDVSETYLLRKNTLSKEAVGFELIDINAEKAIRGRGTEFNDDAMSITWKDEKGSEIQINFDFTKSSSSVTHIASASPAYKYTFTISDGKTSTTADMATEATPSGNQLVLSEATVPGSVAILNNIRLAPSVKAGSFSLTAGNDGDENMISGIGSNFSESPENQYVVSVNMGSMDRLYTITISYVLNKV
jgi:hypothetical protein